MLRGPFLKPDRRGLDRIDLVCLFEPFVLLPLPLQNPLNKGRSEGIPGRKIQSTEDQLPNGKGVASLKTAREKNSSAWLAG